MEIVNFNCVHYNNCNRYYIHDDNNACIHNYCNGCTLKIITIQPWYASIMSGEIIIKLKVWYLLGLLLSDDLIT